MIIDKKATSDWWTSEGGFFGKLYAEADNSLEGFLNNPQQMEQRIKDEVEGVIRLCKLNKGDAVVDCPCGYGRHTCGLASLGLNLTGFDVNDEHLAIAKEQVKKLNLDNVKFVQNDMRKMNFKDEFNALINMFYSFGFFENEADDQTSIDNFCKALKPGGKFLMHTFITLPKIKSGDYKKKETRNLKSGKQLELYRDYDEETKREFGEWYLVDKDGSKQELAPYSMRIYTDGEYREMCAKAGFSRVDVYGDWQGAPYQDNSELMIVVATK